MKTYTVKYRRVGSDAWKVIEGVCEDGIAGDQALRYFSLSTGERHEVPTRDVEFLFSRERFDLLLERHEAAEQARLAAATAKKSEGEGDAD